MKKIKKALRILQEERIRRNSLELKPQYNSFLYSNLKLAGLLKEQEEEEGADDLFGGGEEEEEEGGEEEVAGEEEDETAGEEKEEEEEVEITPGDEVRLGKHFEAQLDNLLAD